MATLGDRFRLVYDSHGETADGPFLARVHDRGLAHIRRSSWPTTERQLDRIGRAVLVERNESHTSRACRGS